MFDKVQNKFWNVIKRFENTRLIKPVRILFKKGCVTDIFPVFIYLIIHVFSYLLATYGDLN